MGKDTEKLFSGDLYFPHAFLVAASAGAGKTYALAWRYVIFLLSEKSKADPSQILAVTFTKNAAREMRERILNILKEISLGKESLSEAQKYLKSDKEELKKRAKKVLEQILINYCDFHVSTIDSFISALGKVSSLDLGLSPDFEIVFETSLSEDLDFASFMSSHISQNKEEIEEFLKNLNLNSDKFLFSPAYRVKEYFKSFRDKENKYLLPLTDSGFILEDIKKSEEEIFEEIRKLADSYKGSDIEKKIKKTSSDALQEKDAAKLIKNFDSTMGIVSGQCAKDMKALVSANLRIKEIYGKIKEYKEKKSYSAYDSYVRFYLKYKDFYDKSKEAKKSLTLGLLSLKLASRIKEGNIGDFYLKLASKFSHFFIDEFQDTSPAQWQIIKPLAEDALAQKGSLFLIGDLKQAIYLFRNADYKIMYGVINRDKEKLDFSSLEKGPEIFKPEINYRCKEEIIKYAQKTFSGKKFKEFLDLNGLEDITGLSECFQKAAKKDKGYVKTYVLIAEKESEEEEEKKYLSILKEAISDLSERYDLKDIAVLASDNSCVERAVSVINDMKIPAASYSALDIRKRKIISEIISLLNFFNLTSDDTSFACFIKGEIFSKIFQNSEEIDSFLFENRDVKIKYSFFRKKFPDIWENYFEEAFAKSGYLSVYELLTMIYEKFKINENFPQEQGFLLKLLDCADKLNEGDSACSLSDFLNRFDQMSEDESSLPLPKQENAVQVMTFHKAKGLGFKAVINLFLEKKDPNKDFYFETQKDSVKILKINKDAAEKSETLSQIYYGDKSEEYLQKLNTLYVALTRAENELYNIVFLKKEDSKSVYSILEEFEGGEKSKSEKTLKGGEYLEVSFSKKEIWNFVKEGESCEYEVKRGEFYHALASLIKDKSDFDSESFKVKSRETAEFYGFSNEDIKDAEIKIKTFFQDERYESFFSAKDSSAVYNETPLISEDGSVIRPDRITVRKEGVFITDYKTGDKKDYSYQINKYKKAARKAFGKEVFSLICYLDLGEAEEI
ncbi:MAG: UvrD-helicase domain-containing protein [Elusimicrobiota bacterium]